MRKEFKTKSLNAWERILNTIFDNKIPEEFTWTEKNEIIRILNIIGSEKSMNHMFFPGGGGMDLDGAEDSIEENCIDLIIGNVHLMINAKNMTFNSFGKNNEWSYFRIETNEIGRSKISEDDYDANWKREEVGVLPNGNYISRYEWDDKEYYDAENDELKELPSKTYLMVRNRKGSFVIFAKGSLYNEVPVTYDGRHNIMTAEEFKNLIQRNYKDEVNYSDT